MRCDHCGKEIDRDSEFCKFCGNAVVRQPDIEDITDAPTQAESNDSYSPSYEERVQAYEKYRAEINTPKGYRSQKSAQGTSVPTKKRASAGLTLLLIILAPFSFAIIGMLEISAQSLFTSNSSVSEPASQASPSATPSSAPSSMPTVVLSKITEDDVKAYGRVMIEAYMEKLGYKSTQWGFLIKGEKSHYHSDDDTWSHVGFVMWPNGQEVSYAVAMAIDPNDSNTEYKVEYYYLEVNYQKILNEADPNTGLYKRKSKR